MNLDLYILSAKIAIVAYIYSDVLTEPGMILNWLFHLLNRLPEWLFKPLIGCYKCVAGQMALWCYIPVYFGISSVSGPFYCIGNHIFFVSLTIFLTWIISKAAERLNKSI